MPRGRSGWRQATTTIGGGVDAWARAYCTAGDLPGALKREQGTPGEARKPAYGVSGGSVVGRRVRVGVRVGVCEGPAGWVGVRVGVRVGGWVGGTAEGAGGGGGRLGGG